MKDKKKSKKVVKNENDDMNVTQRQATNYVVKMILFTVVALLVVFVTLFAVYNFIYPTATQFVDVVDTVNGGGIIEIVDSHLTIANK